MGRHASYRRAVSSRRAKSPTPREGPSDIEREAGARARAIRESAGRIQADVAEAAGVSVKTIGAFELGLRGVSFDTLVAIARALRVDPLALLFSLDEPPPVEWLAKTLLESAGPPGALEAVVRAMASKRRAVECLASVLLKEAGPSAAMQAIARALESATKVDAES